MGSLVLWPLTLAMVRASQGLRWQGRRTQAHPWVRQGRGRNKRCHLAVLNAANVSGRGTRDEANQQASVGAYTGATSRTSDSLAVR